VTNDVGWFKVRDAGTYLVTVSAKIGISGPWTQPGAGYIGLGVFAARPIVGGKSAQPAGVNNVPKLFSGEKLKDTDNQKYEVYRQPACLASRTPLRVEVDLGGGAGAVVY
jgi:hypothetical protein